MNWTVENEKFIRQNWSHMTAKELAKSLGRTNKSVKSKVEKMIRAGKLEKKDELKSQVYGGSNLQSSLEVYGRKNTKNIKNIKNLFYINQEIKIKTNVNHRKTEIVQGKVIQKTDSLVAIKTENYIKTFKFKDFLTKDSIVINII